MTQPGKGRIPVLESGWASAGALGYASSVKDARAIAAERGRVRKVAREINLHVPGYAHAYYVTLERANPRAMTVRPVKLQGRLEETLYKHADDGRFYRHEGNADLWLIETRDGQRGTLALPRRGQGWTRSGRTTWLTNAPERKPTMAHKTKKKRPVPAGYSSWKQYMASIRGMRKGAKRSSSSKAVARPAKRRAGAARVVVVNKPGRRRARRNPPAFSLAGIFERVWNGALGGATIVATEVATRLIRSRALGMPAGTLLAGATELGISTAAGLATEKFMGGPMGARFGQLIVDGGFASVFRATLKQMNAPWVSDALADDTRRNFVVRNGRVFPVNGYVPGVRRMNGYVPGRALGGYVRGNGTNGMTEAAYAAMSSGR